MLAMFGVRRRTVVREALLSCVLCVGACSSNTEPNTAENASGLRVAAATTVGSTSAALRVDVTVVNLGRTPVSLSGGACGKVHVALYDTAAHSGAPAWRLPESVCLPVLPPPLMLAPGDSTTYVAAYDTENADVAAPLPAGVYHVTATLSVPEMTRVLDAGTVTITP